MKTELILFYRGKIIATWCSICKMSEISRICSYSFGLRTWVISYPQTFTGLYISLKIVFGIKFFKSRATSKNTDFLFLKWKDKTLLYRSCTCNCKFCNSVCIIDFLHFSILRRMQWQHCVLSCVWFIDFTRLTKLSLTYILNAVMYFLWNLPPFKFGN